MSDLSIIAHDYELNAEFARKFNEAVLNLKRLYLLRRAAKPENEAGVEESRYRTQALIGVTGSRATGRSQELDC